MNALSGHIAADCGSPIDLAAAAADPRHAFLRSAWFDGAERTLVAHRDDGSVAAALPVARRSGLLRQVPGSYWPCRSFPVALDLSDDELAGLLSTPALGPVWRLGPVREDDPTGRRLASAAARSGWTVLRRRLGTCFVLDLASLRREGPWPRTATLRKNRWHERRLAGQGELAFETISGRGWTPRVFETLAAIERNSWVGLKTDGRDAKFLAPHNRRFWEQAAEDPVLAELMRAHILSVGGSPAAFTFAIEAGPRLSFVANGYDERFARHSPGRVLLYRELQRAFEAGLDEVDWGVGDAGYKGEMGASPGPEMLDWLFVRSRLLAVLLRALWERRPGS